MIKNSVPLEAIPALSPEEKQNHTIGLLTSIDNTLKKLLVWAEPSAFGNQVEMQYEMIFGKEVDFDLSNLSSTAVSAIAGAVANAPTKPAAKSKAKAATAAAIVPAVETTLSPTPVVAQAPATTPPVAPAIQESTEAPITIDMVRSSAEKFIIKLTTDGQNGREAFSKLLKAQGVSILTALDKSKYSILLAEMAKLVPSVAAEVFDPLA